MAIKKKASASKKKATAPKKKAAASKKKVVSTKKKATASKKRVAAPKKKTAVLKKKAADPKKKTTTPKKEVSASKKIVSTQKPLARSVAMIAEKALEKYETWYRSAITRVDDAEFFKKENSVSWRAPVSAQEVSDAEKRLGLKLPPSYVRFVTGRGLFNFGEPDSCESSIDAPAELNPITVTLETEFGFTLADEFTPEEIKKMKRIIRFSFGDENQQIVYCYVFRCDLRKGDEGEALISAFDQDAMRYTWSEPYGREPKSFDEHICQLVDAKIQTSEEYIEEGRYS
jgi:hypothetical protein